MAENSKIEWTTHTFNMWRGCTKVAEGCKFCYADDLSKRNPGTLGIWGPNGTRVVASEKMWKEPLKWNAEAENATERPRVLCASLADALEDWQGPIHNHLGQQLFTINGEEWFTEGEYPECRPLTMHDVRVFLFNVIYATKNLDWLVLTKRPENIPGFIGGVSGAGLVGFREMYPNLWIGTSVATQADADRNIPLLLKCRDLAPVLFVSAEPLLGPVDITRLCEEKGLACPGVDCLDWVIVGGESGPNARPMHPDWARSLRDQCQAAGVPFLFKQNGEWVVASDDNLGRHGMRWDMASEKCCFLDIDATVNSKSNEGISEEGYGMIRVGKKAAGRLLDELEWNEYPTGQASVAAKGGAK